MSTPKKSLGHLYIAYRSCGRVTALHWDSPALRDQIRIAVAEWLERGDIVRRVEQFEGDPAPEFVCSPNESCRCRS